MHSDSVPAQITALTLVRVTQYNYQPNKLIKIINNNKVIKNCLFN